MRDWLERVDWTQRRPPLEGLIVRRKQRGWFAVIETSISVDERLGRLWTHLDQPTAILAPAGFDQLRHLLLRYAAIDWRFEPVELASEASRIRGARWGIELTDAYDAVRRHLPEHERAPFANPMTLVDLDGHVRLGFRTRDPARTAPEVNEAWPACPEPGLVHAVGRALGDLVDRSMSPAGDPLHAIVGRCLARDPGDRFASLAELADAFAALGVPRYPSRRSSHWTYLETTIGLHLAGETEIALELARKARRSWPTSELAFDVVDVVARGRPVAFVDHLDPLPWRDVGPRVAELERIRDYVSAFELVRSRPLNCAEGTEVALAVARLALATERVNTAIEYAERVLRDHPLSAEAHAVRASALARLDRHADTLLAAESWITAAPHDGRAHHALGQVLVKLGRPADARTSFDRAAQLAPELVAASFARTNLDRETKALRTEVGVESPRTLDIPPHLATELGPLIAADRIADAIAWLAARTDDADAHRFLATCHEYLGDHRAALAVFDELGDIIGSGRCLIALDRLSEALVVLARSDDPAAIALRGEAEARLRVR